MTSLPSLPHCPSTSRFDQRAHDYALHAHVQRDLAEWLAEWCVPADHGSAIEFGAGDGIFTQHAVRRLPNLVATDISSRMILRGRLRVPSAQWRLVDAWNPGTPPRPFETILSASLLQWCPDPLGTLMKWKQWISPGGSMLHGFYVAPTLPELNEIIGNDRLPLRCISAGEWEHSFRLAGLSVVRSEARRREYHYTDSRQLLRSLHSTGATGSPRLSFRELRDLLADYDDRFRCSGNCSVQATWTFFRIEVENR